MVIRLMVTLIYWKTKGKTNLLRVQGSDFCYFSFEFLVSCVLSFWILETAASSEYNVFMWQRNQAKFHWNQPEKSKRWMCRKYQCLIWDCDDVFFSSSSHFSNHWASWQRLQSHDIFSVFVCLIHRKQIFIFHPFVHTCFFFVERKDLLSVTIKCNENNRRKIFWRESFSLCLISNGWTLQCSIIIGLHISQVHKAD